MSEKIERIEKDNEVLAIVVRAGLDDKMNFITPDNFPIQLGFQNRDQGEKVDPHLHREIEEIKNVPAHEIFYIISGKVKVKIFDNKKEIVDEKILNDGDTIFLASGHSVDFLEKTKLFEIKQGPYRGKAEEKEFFQ